MTWGLPGPLGRPGGEPDGYAQGPHREWQGNWNKGVALIWGFDIFTHDKNDFFFMCTLFFPGAKRAETRGEDRYWTAYSCTAFHLWELWVYYRQDLELSRWDWSDSTSNCSSSFRSIHTGEIFDSFLFDYFIFLTISQHSGIMESERKHSTITGTSGYRGGKLTILKKFHQIPPKDLHRT